MAVTPASEGNFAGITTATARRASPADVGRDQHFLLAVQQANLPPVTAPDTSPDTARNTSAEVPASLVERHATKTMNASPELARYPSSPARNATLPASGCAPVATRKTAAEGTLPRLTPTPTPARASAETAAPNLRKHTAPAAQPDRNISPPNAGEDWQREQLLLRERDGGIAVIARNYFLDENGRVQFLQRLHAALALTGKPVTEILLNGEPVFPSAQAGTHTTKTDGVQPHAR